MQVVSIKLNLMPTSQRSQGITYCEGQLGLLAYGIRGVGISWGAMRCLSKKDLEEANWKVLV